MSQSVWVRHGKNVAHLPRSGAIMCAPAQAIDSGFAPEDALAAWANGRVACLPCFKVAGAP